jgi:hypothetical protein
MNFLFINYSINWVYLLYKEYILSFNEFIKKYYYEKNINIEIKHFDIENLNLTEFENLNFLKYNKIFYTGNLTILKLVLYNKNYDLNNFYYVNIERSAIADKLQPRNINISFTNNSLVAIDMLVFIFYSDELILKWFLYNFASYSQNDPKTNAYILGVLKSDTHTKDEVISECWNFTIDPTIKLLIDILPKLQSELL